MAQSQESIRNLMNAVKTAQNPEAMLNLLAQKNPQLREALELAKNSGGSPKEAFYKRAEELGVDPDDILNMLK